ncbi:hypothetical protein BJP05_05550 [Corynebacterium sp. NML98-0116]|nr:hypothetical protein BJP05_05550 [Corynebacterium sp. NML98-0116]OIR40473.1 hypothetical protein BJP06_11160 [Corynebacterium sp. NML120713]
MELVTPTQICSGGVTFRASQREVFVNLDGIFTLRAPDCRGDNVQVEPGLSTRCIDACKIPCLAKRIHINPGARAYFHTDRQDVSAGHRLVHCIDYPAK